MKLPSINQILQGALRTLVRFPLVLLSALVATVCALILVDYEGPEAPTILFPILFAAILEIPLLLGLALVAEKMNWSRTKSLALQLVGVIVLVGYAFTVPTTLSAGPAYHVQRLLLLAIAAHLFVSVGPFLNKGEENGFWQYNKTLLFRILGAALYSHILYLGLCLALAALDQLFGINIPGKRYGELWIITFGILNTWLFLAGIPGDLKSLEQVTEYPKGLKIFVQYVLAPLAVIYLVIVYAYVAKIALSWEWSEGWISKLILGFATAGIVSLLLLHPLRGREETGWVKTASRWFYIVMIPLIIMFPLAVWRRIAEFGVTEARYGAAALAAWLIFVVVYFIFSKSKSIKVIPASLGIFSLAVCFGPWSMFHVAEQSQTARLQKMLVQDSILVDGKVQKASAPVRYEDSKHISSILDYLHDIHGFEGIQPWFRESLRKDSAGASLGWKEPALVAGMMGIEYVRLWPSNGGNLVTFSMNQEVSVDVQGFDRMIRLQYINRGGVKKEITGEGTTFELSASLDTLTIRSKSGENEWRSLRIEFLPLAANLLADYANESVGNVPPEKMTVSSAAEGIKAKVFLRNIQVRRIGETIEINSISADIVYSK